MKLGSTLCVALLILLGAAGARAQTRIVRLVLGFPPGESADFLGRAMAERLGQGLGATIVIDNRPGAGSNIATEYVAHADPAERFGPLRVAYGSPVEIDDLRGSGDLREASQEATDRLMARIRELEASLA